MPFRRRRAHPGDRDAITLPSDKDGFVYNRPEGCHSGTLRCPGRLSVLIERVKCQIRLEGKFDKLKMLTLFISSAKWMDNSGIIA